MKEYLKKFIAPLVVGDQLKMSDEEIDAYIEGWIEKNYQLPEMKNIQEFGLPKEDMGLLVCGKYPDAPDGTSNGGFYTVMMFFNNQLINPQDPRLVNYVTDYMELPTPRNATRVSKNH